MVTPEIASHGTTVTAERIQRKKNKIASHGMVTPEILAPADSQQSIHNIQSIQSSLGKQIHSSNLQ